MPGQPTAYPRQEDDLAGPLPDDTISIEEEEEHEYAHALAGSFPTDVSSDISSDVPNAGSEDMDLISQSPSLYADGKPPTPPPPPNLNPSPRPSPVLLAHAHGLSPGSFGRTLTPAPRFVLHVTPPAETTEGHAVDGVPAGDPPEPPTSTSIAGGGEGGEGRDEPLDTEDAYGGWGVDPGECGSAPLFILAGPSTLLHLALLTPRAPLSLPLRPLRPFSSPTAPSSPSAPTPPPLEKP